jgi:hypothetical protein
VSQGVHPPDGPTRDIPAAPQLERGRQYFRRSPLCSPLSSRRGDGGAICSHQVRHTSGVTRGVPRILLDGCVSTMARSGVGRVRRHGASSVTRGAMCVRLDHWRDGTPSDWSGIGSTPMAGDPEWWATEMLRPRTWHCVSRPLTSETSPWCGTLPITFVNFGSAGGRCFRWVRHILPGVVISQGPGGTVRCDGLWCGGRSKRGCLTCVCNLTNV